MTAFFHTTLYVPIYNLLVFFIGVLPQGDVGLAVILVTLAVKIIIMPLSFQALRTTRAMKAIEPELSALKETYKDDKEAQAKETFALYKKYRINPFASFFTILIQLPILISLYWVFRNKTLFTINTDLLYSFVHAPTLVSHLFLGLISVSGASLLLAVLAALTQFVQAYYSIPMPPKAAAGKNADMQADFARAMTLQMRYVLPIIIGAVAYTSGAIALYFITSSLVAVAQEFIVRRQKFSPPDSTSAPV